MSRISSGGIRLCRSAMVVGGGWEFVQLDTGSINPLTKDPHFLSNVLDLLHFFVESIDLANDLFHPSDLVIGSLDGIIGSIVAGLGRLFCGVLKLLYTPLYGQQKVVEAGAKIGKTTWVENDSAGEALTTGGAGSARARLGMPAPLTATFDHDPTLSGLLGDKLLMMAEEQEL